MCQEINNNQSTERIDRLYNVKKVIIKNALEYKTDDATVVEFGYDLLDMNNTLVICISFHKHIF